MKFNFRNFSFVVRAQRRAQGRHKNQPTKVNRYRRSNVDYDSHGETDEECPHCGKHSGIPSDGKHADCCPRYVDASLSMKDHISDDEDYLGKKTHGMSPQKRRIDPLHRSCESFSSNEMDADSNAPWGNQYVDTSAVDDKLHPSNAMDTLASSASQRSKQSH